MIIIKTQHRNKNKFPHKNKPSVIGSTVINKTLFQETFRIHHLKLLELLQQKYFIKHD